MIARNRANRESLSLKRYGNPVLIILISQTTIRNNDIREKRYYLLGYI